MALLSIWGSGPTAPCEIRRLQQEHFDGSQQSWWLAYRSTTKFEATGPLPPYSPVHRLQRQDWNIPYVSFVSDMPIESTATPLTPPGRWVRLFICNHADVKKVMGKLPNKNTFSQNKAVKYTTTCAALLS